MGCDIHLMTERLRTINDEQKWFCVDNFKPNAYFREDDKDYGKEFELISIYNDRNYNLFSMLANVRNYSENEFISEPKGVPENCSKYTKKEIDEWGVDGHSHSYFTLEDLKKFKKENPTQKHSGKMPLTEAEKIDKGDMPDFWCQSSSDESYVYREWTSENKVLDDLIEKIEEKKKDEFWIFSPEQDKPEFDKQIRIVFWFDN